MKKLILLTLLFLFLSFTKASYIENDNFVYDEAINVIQNKEKIEVKNNTNYYFVYIKLYTDYDYFKELEDNSITSRNLIIKTDTLNEKIMFKTEKMSFGTAYYAKFTTTTDNFIYYISAPATKDMKMNRDFFLLEEDEFLNLNTYYNDSNLEEEKIDYDGIYYVDIDNLVDKSIIISNIKAVDNNDGVLENIELIYDEYTNKSSIGSYLMKFQVKDSSNNLSEYKLLVKVVDITKPKIETKGLTKRIEISNKEKLSYEDLLDLVSVNDNTCDMTGRIRIKENEYFRNESNDGEYKIVFYAEDLYGNFSTLDFIIGVGKGSVKYAIEKYESDNLTAKDICDKYFTSLKLTTNYEITSDTYTSSQNNVGEYFIGVSYYNEGLKYDLIKVNVIKYEEPLKMSEEDGFNYLWLLLMIPVLGGVAAGIIIFKKKRIKFY